MNKVELMGIPIDGLTWPQLKAQLLDFTRTRRGAVVGNVNAHAMNLARRDPEFKAFFKSCDLVFCDGEGVRLAARLMGHPLPERMTYPDVVFDLARASAQRGLRWFLLGARPGVAEKAAVRLTRAVPDLHIAGWHHGYFDHRPGSPEDDALVRTLNRLQPDVLFVCFGMPLQERWIQVHRDRLDVGVMLPAGALLDYLAGTLRRAPRWMTDHGLEWLGRLMIEPHRLWRRYLFGLPHFFVGVLLDAVTWTGTKGTKDSG